MFCFQRSFGLPTEVVTLEQFEALLSAPQTFTLVKEAREALEKGDKATYDRKKKQLPFVIFILRIRRLTRKPRRGAAGAVRSIVN